MGPLFDSQALSTSGNRHTIPRRTPHLGSDGTGVIVISPGMQQISRFSVETVSEPTLGATISRRE